MEKNRTRGLPLVGLLYTNWAVRLHSPSGASFLHPLDIPEYSLIYNLLEHIRNDQIFPSRSFNSVYFIYVCNNF